MDGGTTAGSCRTCQADVTCTHPVSVTSGWEVYSQQMNRAG